MSQKQKLFLIEPLVDHMLAQADVSDYRNGLIDSGVLSKEEVMALNADALKACYKTMQMMQLLHKQPEEIMSAIEQHEVCWKIDMDDDFQQGAICY